MSSLKPWSSQTEHAQIELVKEVIPALVCFRLLKTPPSTFLQNTVLSIRLMQSCAAQRVMHVLPCVHVAKVSLETVPWWISPCSRREQPTADACICGQCDDGHAQHTHHNTVHVSLGQLRPGWIPMPTRTFWKYTHHVTAQWRSKATRGSAVEHTSTLDEHRLFAVSQSTKSTPWRTHTYARTSDEPHCTCILSDLQTCPSCVKSQQREG